MQKKYNLVGKFVGNYFIGQVYNDNCVKDVYFKEIENFIDLAKNVHLGISIDFIESEQTAKEVKLKKGKSPDSMHDHVSSWEDFKNDRGWVLTPSDGFGVFVDSDGFITEVDDEDHDVYGNNPLGYPKVVWYNK